MEMQIYWQKIIKTFEFTLTYGYLNMINPFRNLQFLFQNIIKNGYKSANGTKHPSPQSIQYMHDFWFFPHRDRYFMPILQPQESTIFF